MFQAPQALAQGSISVSQPVGFQVTDVGTIVSGAIGAAFIIAGLIIFSFIAFGGLLMITSGGDKTQSEKGRSAVTGAAVGFAVIAAAWAITMLVEYIFGFNILGGVTLPTFY